MKLAFVFNNLLVSHVNPPNPYGHRHCVSPDNSKHVPPLKQGEGVHDEGPRTWIDQWWVRKGIKKCNTMKG